MGDDCPFVMCIGLTALRLLGIAPSSMFVWCVFLFCSCFSFLSQWNVLCSRVSNVCPFSLWLTVQSFYSLTAGGPLFGLK
ncbi:hypothetical protein XELAEV_18009254mg [Xenopus laevis]|uniref:Uncharacterized protein n=1 Tax=Xenopus laevis TaxID=8355 RepID=A0A974DS18_XENLA|nr:hypothetical protein XELAEV_18009254mg [Xenopus laevis]